MRIVINHKGRNRHRDLCKIKMPIANLIVLQIQFKVLEEGKRNNQLRKCNSILNLQQRLKANIEGLCNQHDLKHDLIIRCCQAHLPNKRPREEDHQGPMGQELLNPKSIQIQMKRACWTTATLYTHNNSAKIT